LVVVMMGHIDPGRVLLRSDALGYRSAPPGTDLIFHVLENPGWASRGILAIGHFARHAIF